MSDVPYDHDGWGMGQDYEAPPGKEWFWVGTCPCRGHDHDCVFNDDNWELRDLDA